MHGDYVIDIRFDSRTVDHDLTVTGDIELLRIVILNLIENACKYSDDRSVRVTLTSDERFVLVDFINRTDSLSPDEYEKIFEPFYRGRTPNKVDGSGIGLSLIKRIVEIHNGIISVNSHSDNSLRFRLILNL